MIIQYNSLYALNRNNEIWKVDFAVVISQSISRCFLVHSKLIVSISIKEACLVWVYVKFETMFEIVLYIEQHVL